MIRPSKDRILLERIEPTKKAGAIILTNEKKENRGIVLDIGKDIEEDIQEGDIIIFAQYTPIELMHNEKTYLLIKESDILAIEHD